jgi:hypothetical protein
MPLGYSLQLSRLLDAKLLKLFQCEISAAVLGFASLSLPHFDANPFWKDSGDMPDFPASNPHRQIVSMA